MNSKWFVKAAFLIVYPATFVLFGYGFFTSQFPARDNGAMLFDLVALTKVHEFALPVLLMMLEMFSTNLAVGFWRERGLRRMLVLLIFVLMQGFPIAATFFGSRLNQKAQLAKNEEAAWNNDADKLANERHGRDLAQWQKAKDDYRALIRDTTTRLSKLEADATVERKVIEFPVSLAALNAAKVRLDGVTASISSEQKSKQAYEAQLFALEGKPPTMPALSTDGQKRTALPSDLTFIIQTAGQPEALLSLALVVILVPGLLLGAGYYFASGPNDEDPSRAAVVSLARELAACVRLQPAEQRLFAESLVSVARAGLEGQKAVHDTGEILMVTHLAGQHAQDRGRSIEALIREVRSSRITNQAKAVLITFLDQTLRGAPAAA